MSDFMNSVFPYLLLLLLPGLIVCVVTLIRDAGGQSERLVRNSPASGVVGMGCSVLCGVIALICRGSGAEYGVTILFAVIALLSQVLIAAYVNCRIRYDDDGFDHKDFFGVRHRYRYSDVTGIRTNDHETIIRLGRRRVMVDEIGIGGSAFLFFVQRRYKAENRGREIPVTAPRLDLYRGHIVNGHSLTVVSICMYALCIATCLFLVFVVEAYPADKLETREVCFVSCRTPLGRRGNWELTDEQGRRYRLPYRKDVMETLDASAFRGSSVCTVTGKGFEDDGVEYLLLLTISREGQEVVTQAQAEQYVHNRRVFAFSVGMVMILMWSAYFIPGIFIGRNPKKHPKLAKLLFDKENIIWN